MKPIEWNKEKNDWLMRERGVSFEEVAVKIEAANVIAVVPNPNSAQYPHQQVYILELRGYVYTVPFVEDDRKIFLKTIIPSRKRTRQYYQERKEL